jgi:hypothetical protein
MKIFVGPQMTQIFLDLRRFSFGHFKKLAMDTMETTR